jgi:lipopolysaccharide export system protein LptC
VPRTHLLILALGVLIVVFAGLGEGARDAEPTARVLDESPEDAGELGEPDLLMETAEISQFAVDGELAYRILAVRIVHSPEADHPLLDAPRLTLYREDEAPWEVSAERGRVIGGTGLLDAGLLPGSATSTSSEGRETVELQDDVVVQRRRPGEGFIELHTEALTLYPAEEYAETERPVIIDTQSGRTTAEGLRADLAAGTIALGTPPRRVRTTIFPGTL